MPLPEYVGNDVVDLDDPAIVEHHSNRRFVPRVCALEEQHALARAADQKAHLWSLFAAKEAAFKLAVKRLGPLAFAHRAFVVSDDFSAVRYAEHRFPLSLATGPGWLHALVSTASAVFCVELLQGETPGATAREALSALVARVSRLSRARLRVERERSHGSWDGLGPPRLVCGKRAAAIDVSLSHDGRFVAAAAIVRASASQNASAHSRKQPVEIDVPSGERP